MAIAQCWFVPDDEFRIHQWRARPLKSDLLEPLDIPAPKNEVILK
jgi:hypothetical protein